MTKPVVFVSHISPEAKLAEILTSQISQDFLGLFDLFVMSDDISISLGSKWINVVSDALKNAQVMLIICSRQSIKRPWINFEAGAGWIKDIPVVPVCHTGMTPEDLPIPLNLLQAISASDIRGLERLYGLLANQLVSCPTNNVRNDLVCAMFPHHAVTGGIQ